MLFYQCRDSYCGDKTIKQPSYFYSGISCAGKTTISYQIKAQAAIEKPTQWIDGTPEKQLFAWNKIFLVKTDAWYITNAHRFDKIVYCLGRPHLLGPLGVRYIQVLLYIINAHRFDKVVYC